MFMKFLTALLNKDAGKALINGSLIVAVSVWGYYRAYNSGVNDTTLAYEQAEKTAINKQLIKISDEIVQANAASRAISEKLAEYQNQGDRTTHELQQILSQDASSRRDCRYSLDSMRRLAEARARATQAVTGGINGTLSNDTAITAKSQ